MRSHSRRHHRCIPVSADEVEPATAAARLEGPGAFNNWAAMHTQLRKMCRDDRRCQHHPGQRGLVRQRNDNISLHEPRTRLDEAGSADPAAVQLADAHMRPLCGRLRLETAGNDEVVEQRGDQPRIGVRRRRDVATTGTTGSGCPTGTSVTKYASTRSAAASRRRGEVARGRDRGADGPLRGTDTADHGR